MEVEGGFWSKEGGLALIGFPGELVFSRGLESRSRGGDRRTEEEGDRRTEEGGESSDGDKEEVTGERSWEGGETTWGGGRERERLVAWYGKGCCRLFISCWVFRSMLGFSGLSFDVDDVMFCRRLSALRTVPLGDRRWRPSVLMNLPSAVIK